MINQKEHLAALIVKNLIFVVLFIVFSFYGISLFLLPKVQDFQDAQYDFKEEQLFEIKMDQKNKEIQTQIQDEARKNQLFLQTLRKNPDAEKIKIIAQDFLQSCNVEEVKKQQKLPFVEVTFKISGIANGTQAVFDLLQKLKENFSNSTPILPLLIEKQDLVTNALTVTIHFKMTQIQSNITQNNQ